MQTDMPPSNLWLSIAIFFESMPLMFKMLLKLLAFSITS